jgi:hypothetical protein
MPRHEDDDRPRRRPRPRDEDDEEERPRSKSRRPPDEDDDRPRTRRPRYDDEDDRPRRKSRRERDEDDYDDRPRRRSKGKAKSQQVSVPGMLALVTGGLALGLSFTCFGGLAIIPGLIGLGLGIFGFVAAQKSGGRQSPWVPAGGAVVSLAAVVVSTIAIISFTKAVKEIGDDFKEAEAEWTKREAERAKAAAEVKAAGAGAVVRVTAAQFYKAYDDDEDRADLTYKNKVIEVTGTFHEVDFTGDEFTIMLRAGQEEFETVDCNFAKDPGVRERLAQLKPGQTVTIRGKCLGGISDLEACILVN